MIHVIRAALFLLLCASAFAADSPRRTSGKYAVTLRVPEGGLFAAEEMEIEFRVEDTSRPDPVSGFSPVIRATPSATIDMPSMPGMPKFAATAHAEGVPGDYGIHPAFAHGGEYRLRIEVQPPSADAFTVEFPLDVADASHAKRKPLPPRYRLEVSAKNPKAGAPVELQLVVRDREKGTVRDFETVHEALMHLVIVRRDLAHFAHEHPALQADGTFRLKSGFAEPGDYRLFADVAPRGAGSQIVSANLKVGGNGHSITPHDLSDTIVDLISPEGPLPAGKTLTVRFRVRDFTTKQPVTDLSPYLGVMGHLMIVHEDAATFVHSHPVDDTSMDFLVRLPKPGTYKAWLQFRRGSLYTREFTFYAGAGK